MILNNRITVDFGEDSSDLKTQLKVDKVNLDVEFTEQPSLFAYWATLSEDARERYEQVSLELEILEAELDEQMRKGAETSNTRITENAIKSAIVRNSDWQEKSRERLGARKDMLVMQAATEAFKQRKDMLTALGFARRDEENASVMRTKADRTLRDDYEREL